MLQAATAKKKSPVLLTFTTRRLAELLKSKLLCLLTITLDDERRCCLARPDPADYLGVLVYLMREKNYDAAMVEALVSRQSGLLGISGTDSDMRRLHQNALTNADSCLAIEMFCYSVRKQFAS